MDVDEDLCGHSQSQDDPEQKEQQPTEGEAPQEQTEDSDPNQGDPKPPSEQEQLSPAERQAQQWLDSIPDDRVIIPRHEGRQQFQRGGQSW